MTRPLLHVMLLLVVLTSISSFYFTANVLTKSQGQKALTISQKSLSSQLFMARSFKPTDDVFSVKVKSKKVSKYAMPGYSKGDLDNLKLVFKLFSRVEKQIPCLSLESLINSKYLRYWPGKLDHL